jgi:outer membrane protein OmpA-like peptidoglycan-associated protein
MKLRLALLASVCLGLPLAAHAQPVTGPYVSLGLGTNIMDSQSYNYAINASQSGRFIFRPDYAGVVGLGYGLGNGVRIEIDGNYYRNTVKKQNDNQIGNNTRMHGGVVTYGAMANLMYDIPVGLPIEPYFGGGVGYQEQQFEHLVNGYGDNYSGTAGSFAYDLIAGVSYPIAAVPGLSLTAEYRFMQLTARRKYLDAPGGDLINVGQSANSTLLIGARYALFTPPPPMAPAPAPTPVAAPAPAPARTYLVFFDWDKYNLTPRATQIVSEAAADSQRVQTTTIDVSGYTDTSGTPAYNDKLSMRRAQTVAAQLVADGVAKSEIEIHGYGETHLLVPTGPGVREPQNRRVEIVLK